MNASPATPRAKTRVCRPNFRGPSGSRNVSPGFNFTKGRGLHCQGRRAGAAAATVAAGLILCASIAHAGQTLYWDGGITGSNQGGTGVWDTSSTADWFNGFADTFWTDPVGADTAVFGGTAGTVTLAATETANAITFSTAGYTLTGGALNLTSATASSPQPVINASASATINSAITGSGFTKTGAGNLTLNGATSVTGQIYLNQGAMTLTGAGATISAAGLTIVGTSGQFQSSLATPGDNALASPALYLVDGADSVDHFGATPLTLRGGSIYYSSSNLTGGTIQNLTVATGGIIASQPNGTGSVLNLTNLTVANTATVTFESFNQTIGTGAGNVGDIYIANLSLAGSAAAPPANNTSVMLGANLTVQSKGSGADGNTHFAAYGPNGVTQLTGVVTSLNAANPTDNVEDSGTTITAAKTVNSLASNAGDTHINSAALLTITSGGVIMSGANHWIKCDSGNSSMTAGPGDNYQLIATINGIGTDYEFNHVAVVDNSGTPVTFVKGGIGQLILSSVASTYTGNTYINNGILRLNTANGSAGQLSGTSSIVINAGGTLQLNASDVLGYTAGREVLTINGGTVSNITAANRVTLQNSITMTGGALTGTGAGDANGVFSFDQSGGTVINATSDASGLPAIISAPSVSLQSGQVTFNVTPGAAHPASDLNVTGKIIPYAGSAYGILKTGNGTMALSGASTYTGSTTISGGAVTAATNAPLGAAGAFGNASSAIVLGNAVTTSNNSSPSLFTGGAVTIARPVTVAAQSTAGTYTLGGTASSVSTFSGAITLNEPVVLSQAAGGVLNFTGGITDSTPGFHSINVFGPGTITISTLGISETAGPIALNIQSGTMTFAAPNNYSGGTTISGGNLVLSGAGTLGVINSDVTVNSGSFDIGGTSPSIGNLSGAGGTIFNNGSANGILTIGGGNATGGNYAGILASGTSKLSLNKTGFGAITLSGVNTYTGVTTVTGGGTLALKNTGSTNTIANSPSITVTSGSILDVSGLAGGGIVLGGNQILTGGGSIAGSVGTVAGTTLTPGGAATIGTLSIGGSLNLAAGSNLNFVLGTPGGSASSLGTGSLLTVQNTLTLPSAAGSLTLSLIDNANANGQGTLGNGYYELFTYGTLIGNPTTAFAPAAGKTYTFFTQTVGGVHQLDLQVSVLRLTWTGRTNGTGATDSTWNTTSVNWANNSSGSAYSDGSIVTFNDTNVVAGGAISPTQQNIQIQGAGVAPQSVTFNNSAVTYSMNNAGANGIGGALTSLIANGPGTVILNGANGFGGGTTVAGGTLVVGNVAALGAITSPVQLNSGSLDLATDTSVNAYNVNVGGVATILVDKATSASAGITHAMGALTIGSNQLNVVGGAKVASGTAGLSFGNVNVTGDAIINVTNPAAGGGTLLTLGAVTNASSLTFTGNGNIAQSAPWSGGVIAFDSNFTGTAVLSQSNTYSGGTIVSGGTLQAGNNSALGAINTQAIIGTGAALDLNGFNLSNYPISISGAGPSGNGAIVNSGAAQVQALTNLTLGGDAAIGGGPGVGQTGANRWDIRGVVSVKGNGFNLIKTGSNYIAIAGSTSGLVTGVQSIILNSGILALANNTTVDNTAAGSIIVNPTATLSVSNWGSAPGVVENKPIVMAGGNLQTDTTGTAGNASIAAAISLNSQASISAQTGSNLTLAGVISDGANGSTGAVFGSAANPGTVTLTASNTYSGGTNVSAGILALGFGGATGTLAPGSAVTVNSGTTLQFNVGDAYGYFGGSAAPANVSGTINIVAGQHATLPGIVFNGGVLASAGAGNFSANASNYIFDGTINTVAAATPAAITANAIYLRGQNAPGVGDHSITFNVPRGTAPVDLSVTSAIGDSGFGLTKTGNGILMLKGASTYTGATVINQGTVAITNNTALGTGAVNLGGGTLQLAGQTGAISIKFVGGGGPTPAGSPVSGVAGVVSEGNWNNITGASSAIAIALGDSNGNAGAANLMSFTATNTYSTGSANPVLNGYLDNTGTTQSVVVAGVPYANYSVYAYFGSDAAGRTGSVSLGGVTYDYTSMGSVTTYSLTSDSSGANPSANYAVFGNISTGGFTLTQTRGSNNSGLMAIQIVGNSGINIANSVAVSADSSLDLTGANTGTISGAVTIGSNQLSVTGGSAGANMGYTLNLGGTGGVSLTGSPTFSVANNGTGVGTVVLGAITDTIGGNGLTKSGNGTLVIGGAASYTGPTNINGGTLVVGLSGSLANSTQINIAHGATFDVSGPGVPYVVAPSFYVGATGHRTLSE